MITQKNEKFLIYFSIIVIAIIFVIVIYFIWSPIIIYSSNSDLNNYDSSIEYEDVMIDYYENYLMDNLKISNFENLYNHISSNYMRSLGYENKDQIRQYLIDNNLISMDVNVTNIDYSTDGIKNVYRVAYITHNITKYVNIIENKPYNFVLDFEQDNLKSILNKNREIRNDDILYEFEIIDSNDNSIKYRISLTNESVSDIYKFDFSNLNSLQIIDNYSNYSNMALVANSSSSDYTITPGSSKSIEVLFNISFDRQMNISGFRFNNVEVNDSISSIEVNF